MGSKLGLRREVYQRPRTAAAVGIDEQIFRVRGVVTQAFYAALETQSILQGRKSRYEWRKTQ